MLLAEKAGPINELMNRIETFYDKLAKNGFRKGNDLQFLSHILSLDHTNDENILVERFVKLFDSFKELGIRPKAMHYPSIGLLSLVDDGQKALESAITLAGEINKEKHFKWHKDLNITIAVNFNYSGSAGCNDCYYSRNISCRFFKW